VGTELDAIVVGAGHNGLVTACYMARAGLRVQVLEREAWVGGAAVSRSLHPQYTYSNCSYVCSLLRPEIIRGLELPRHGLQVIPYEGGGTMMKNGNHLAVYSNHDAMRREIARHSKRDAEAYERFSRDVMRQCKFIKPLLMRTPPDPTSWLPRDLMELVFLGQHFHKLGEARMYDTVRFFTMSAADYLDEYFESDIVKAHLAGSSIIGTALGPRSPGTAYVLLHHYMGDIDDAVGAWGFARGGMGAVTQAMKSSLEASGGQIRTSADVRQVLVRHGRACGVALANGEEIRARTVVSNMDVKRTFLKTVAESDLPADFVRAVRNFKIRGSSGKLNIALDGLPTFPVFPADSPCIRGPAHHRDARRGGTRLRRLEGRTLVAQALRRHAAALAHRPDDGPPGQALHVGVRPVRTVQARRRRMEQRAAHRLRQHRHRRHRRTQPGLQVQDRARRDPHPLGHRERSGPDRRQHLPGRTHHGPADVQPTDTRLRAVPLADQGTLHVRFEHPPRWRRDGRPGRQCRAHHPEGPGPGARGMSTPMNTQNAKYDHIIVGGGHNGLVCAATLARQGRRVLVLEAADAVGGAAITREFAPGFHVSAGAHLLHALPESLVRTLGLEQHGLRFAARGLPTSALSESGEAVVFAGGAVSGVGAPDAQAYARFAVQLGRYARIMSRLDATVPFRLSFGTWRERRDALQLALRIRLLGKRDMREFLRIAGMNAYDLLTDTFSSPLLKGALGFDASLGAEYAARSPGTVLTLLQRWAGQDRAGTLGLAQPAGGMGALSQAIAAAARAAGAEIRTGARVQRIVVDNDRAVGVRLDGGETIAARSVISNADPRSTFLKMVGAEYLDTDFVRRIDHFRAKGLVAKVHLALDSLPSFRGVDARGAGGRLLVAPSLDYLELAFNPAKYRDIPEHPALEITLPSVNDSTLAPAGKHVMSINVMFVPYDLGADPAGARARLLGNVLSTLDRHAPGIRDRISASELRTPADLEGEFGMAGGHWHHGALAFDQFFFTRPVPGAAQYATPLPGLYLCGAGSHPGGGVMGLAGMNAAGVVLQGSI